MKNHDFKGYLLELKLREDSEVDRTKYPFSIKALKNFKSLKFNPKVTFIIGENGSGKSTLIEAIAVNLGLNPEGGSKNFKFSTRESHSSLTSVLRLSKSAIKPKDMYFLRSESFFNVASEIENLDKPPGLGPPIISYYGNVSLHEQSHGESFFSLFNHRFYGKGLYLLDEPEAALSPTRQLSFLSRMNQLINDKSQFIISTHSPILMAYPGATIYQLDKSSINKINYQDTEHYQITKEFLNRPEKMLKILLEQE